LRKLALIPLLMLAGCAMAGPGVGSITGLSEPGAPPTTYDNSWVNKKPSEINRIPEPTSLGVDISERQLGQSPWFDGDGNPTAPRKPGWQTRQEERQAARKAEWREKMGITNIKDEQKARNQEQKPASQQD
jgi:hypothetical protein